MNLILISALRNNSFFEILLLYLINIDMREKGYHVSSNKYIKEFIQTQINETGKCEREKDIFL